MKWREKSERFSVVDEFLKEKELEQVWRFFQTHVYFQADARGYRGHWRLDDGRVYKGIDVFYGPGAAAMVAKRQGVLGYPTGGAIDLFIKRFLEASPEFAGLIGEEGKDWTVMVSCPRLYERGAGLYWHRDSPSLLLGSATFYGHPEWNIQWGGELFIAPDSADDVPDEWGPYMNPPADVMGLGDRFLLHSHLDNRHTNERLLRKGLGTFVMAKPNRLVVMKTGTPHMLAKVDDAAGDHVRASITAFFIRKGAEDAGPY